MSDYPISVGVTVEDGQLDALETKINNLKTKTITIDVKTNFLNGNSKDISKLAKSNASAIAKEAQKAVSKTPKIKGSSLTEQLFNPKDSLKTVAKAVKDISKYGNSLNLGEIKLTLNQSIMNELDGLKAKLIEIKSLAQSMGSIKLKISDGLNMVDGAISVSDSSGSKQSKIKQVTTALKKTVEADAAINKELRLGNVTEARRIELERQRTAIRAERNKQLDLVKSTGSVTDYVLAEKTVSDAVKKSERELQSAIESADKYEKVFNTLSDSYNKFDSIRKIAGSKSITEDAVLGRNLNQGFEARLNLLKKDLDNMAALRETMKNSSGEELRAAQASMDLYAAHAKEQERYLKNTKQFYKKDDTKYTKSSYIGVDFDSASDAVQTAMNKMAGELARGKEYTTEYNAAAEKMNVVVDRGSGVMEKYAIAYKNGPGNIESSLTKVTQQVKPLSSYISEIGTKFKSLSQYLISNFGFDVLQAGLSSGIASIKELDSAMTELKKTSTGTKQEYKDFATRARSDAKAIGSTATQITNSAADWSRLGYSLNDSSIMSKTTGILKNVSEFNSIEDATESMIGIMQAYDIQAKDSTTLIDKLNKIGNSYSVSTSNLAKGLQISGSALQVGGNSLDKSVALLTAYNSSIQDIAQASRAARTVSMRMHGVSVEELAAEGEDVEGLIETVPKLEAEIKSLTAVNGKAGISLSDTTGRVKDDFTFLLELAERWNEIGQADIKEGTNRQSKILESLAGEQICLKNMETYFIEHI